MQKHLSREQIETTVLSTSAELRKAMLSGRFSTGLALDIAMLALLGNLERFAVIHEIAILEGTHLGPSGTKPAKRFTGNLLRGLWHKHYTGVTNIARNMQDEMDRDGTVERVWGKYLGQTITQEMVNELVGALVRENYTNRLQRGRLTGEWIVFARSPTGNVYLTLATHLEGYQQILDRLTVYQTLGLQGIHRSAEPLGPEGEDRCAAAVPPSRQAKS